MNAQEAREYATAVRAKLKTSRHAAEQYHTALFKKQVLLTIAEYHVHIEDAVRRGEMFVLFSDAAAGDLFDCVQEELEKEGYSVQFGGWNNMKTISW